VVLPALLLAGPVPDEPPSARRAPAVVPSCCPAGWCAVPAAACLPCGQQPVPLRTTIDRELIEIEADRAVEPKQTLLPVAPVPE
jgi:hypothetical protein